MMLKYTIITSAVFWFLIVLSKDVFALNLRKYQIEFCSSKKAETEENIEIGKYKEDHWSITLDDGSSTISSVILGCITIYYWTKTVKIVDASYLSVPLYILFSSLKVDCISTFR